MRTRALIGLQLLLGAVSLAPLAARKPPAPVTKVPRWDACGIGPLPWQGVACLDIDSQALAIAVGTIVPPGDPNVLLLDGDGKVVRQQRAGQRWINAVGFDGGVIRAVCTMPAGRSGDSSEVFRLTARDVTPEDIPWRRTSYAESYFHYGDHSNHVTRLMTTRGSFTVAVNGDQVHWLDSRQTAAFPLPESAIPVAVAAGGRGVAVVGTAVASPRDAPRPTNLHVLQPANPRPLWSRPVNTETAATPRPEAGRYGRPTLPDGRREALPQRDVPAWAPLAVAVHARWRGTKVEWLAWPGVPMVKPWPRAALMERRGCGTRTRIRPGTP